LKEENDATVIIKGRGGSRGLKEEKPREGSLFKGGGKGEYS